MLGYVLTICIVGMLASQAITEIKDYFRKKKLENLDENCEVK